MSDWIKLHRILLEWEWYTTPNMAHFWVYCLLKASHKDRLWRGILLKEGQFLSGRFVMAAETGLSERQIRTCVARLKTTNEMTSQSTTEYTVFTINSWNKYQILQTSDQQNDQRATNERPTSDHRQEWNKDKNVKKNTGIFSAPTFEEVGIFVKSSGLADFDFTTWYKVRTANSWEKANGRKVKDWKRDIRGCIASGSFMCKQSETTPQYTATKQIIPPADYQGTYHD
jgi:hypothetical protein